MSSTKKRSLLLLAMSVAMLGMSLFVPKAADATYTQGHFHSGFIAIGDDIEVDISNCPEGTPPDGLVLFPINKVGGTGTGTFHCTDIEATGPLGDATVDLLCSVVWEWPPTEGTHASFSCLMHILIETVIGDFLCNLHGAWLTEDTEVTAGPPILIHWFIANASPGFGNVQVTGQCPALIASAIDDIVDDGIEALLHFLFT